MFQWQTWTMAVVVALSAATVSMGNDEKKKKLPWQEPDKTGRPTPGKPNVNPTPATDAIPSECALSLADPGYVMLAEKLAEMTSNRKIVDQLKKDGLDVTTVSWQDPGRSFNSSGGFNISDVRLVAFTKTRDGKSKLIPQPIIRLPNFDDKTVDIDLEKVMVPVGNAWGAEAFAVPLKLILENPQPFLSKKEKLKSGSLLADRDTQVLVSAQASIMPVPRKGQAHFAPSIFNYSSRKENPAVLVILVSNLGTSITIIDNDRDKLSANGLSASGQLLFHNKNGEKAPFVLEALSEVVETDAGKAKVDMLKGSGQSVGGVSGVNQVLMIQVPLKHEIFRGGYANYGGLESLSFGPPVAKSAMRGARGLDTGVVSVADYTLGDFIEYDGLGDKLERDSNAPIRVDVMRYLATDTADLNLEEVGRLPEELRAIYEAGSNLGSLVTDTSTNRVTRNYRPWGRPWWNTVVLPWLPPRYRPNPHLYFEPIYGPNWQYRFGNESSARATLEALGAAKG